MTPLGDYDGTLRPTFSKSPPAFRRTSPASTVPKQTVIALQGEQVLQVTLEADDTGYSVVSRRRTFGAPTLTKDQNKDVLIVATDAAGKTL